MRSAVQGHTVVEYVRDLISFRKKLFKEDDMTLMSENGAVIGRMNNITFIINPSSETVTHPVSGRCRIIFGGEGICEGKVTVSPVSIMILEGVHND